MDNNQTTPKKPINYGLENTNVDWIDVSILLGYSLLTLLLWILLNLKNITIN